MVAELELDMECLLAEVGGDAEELEGLHGRPRQQSLVRRAEAAEVLCERLAIIDGCLVLSSL